MKSFSKTFYKLYYSYLLKKQPFKTAASWDNNRVDYEYHTDYKNLFLTAPKAKKLENYKNTNIIYQVLIYNFADGNNDGIGDFIGLKDKIEYISNLGVDQIWLSPIHPASSYHGYSVIDYCNVDSRLGGMNAFIDFLNTAHEHGIKVYLDMVFNHTSYEHPWFQAALANDGYSDFYRLDINLYDSDVKVDNLKIKSKYPFTTDINATNRTYLARFSYGMPDLNLDNYKVIEQLIHIQKFWTAVGVDGFRYDAFAEYYSSEIETKNNFNEAKIFHLLRDASKQITDAENIEEVFMMGEWVNSDAVKGLMYLKDADGNIGLDTIYDGGKFFRHNPDVRIEYNQLKNMLIEYQNTSQKAKWIPFLDNHDVRRWLEVYRSQISKKKWYKFNDNLTTSEKEALNIALFVLLALPATPIIYAADELYYYSTRYYGDPTLREPMKWENNTYNCFIYDPKVKESFGDHIMFTSALNLESADVQSKQGQAYKLIQFMAKLRKDYPFLSLTDADTIANPYEFVDTIDYNSVIIRKDLGQQKEYLLFAFCNYQHKKLDLLKISRNYHFEQILLYKAKNESWRIWIEQGGYVIFKLIRK
ncbi:alpha-amylase family glycosyl hydrolase [Mycoplasma sp. 4013]